MSLHTPRLKKNHAPQRTPRNSQSVARRFANCWNRQRHPLALFNRHAPLSPPASAMPRTPTPYDACYPRGEMVQQIITQLELWLPRARKVARHSFPLPKQTRYPLNALAGAAPHANERLTALYLSCRAATSRRPSCCQRSRPDAKDVAFA